MKIPLTVTVAISAGRVTKFGAAVEWTLTTGRTETPVPIWVGACRANYLSEGTYQSVVAALLRAALAKHLQALRESITALAAAVDDKQLDVEAHVTEFLPAVMAQLATFKKVIDEITAPDPAKEATP